MATRVPDPQTFANDWVAGTQNNGARWQRNAADAAEATVAGARASGDAWIAGVQEAAAEGRFAQAMNKVTPQDVRNGIQAAGSAAYTDGARRAAPKMVQVAQKLLPLIQAAKDDVSQMPRASQGDRRARMMKNFDNMIEVGKRYRAS